MTQANEKQGKSSAIIVRPHSLLVNKVRPFLKDIFDELDVVTDPKNLSEYFGRDYQLAVVSTSFIVGDGAIDFMDAIQMVLKEWPMAKLFITSTADINRLESFVMNMFVASKLHANPIKPGFEASESSLEKVKFKIEKGTTLATFLVTKHNFENEESIATLSASLKAYLAL